VCVCVRECDVIQETPSWQRATWPGFMYREGRREKIWMGQVTGRHRGECEGSKNVLDRCPRHIKPMAEFLYCGHASSSPDKMSMT